MQVIGLCRFSYPAIGGFQVEHDALDDRIAFLYAPARLEERFRFFETITLPSIRGQLDPDFTFVVLIGDSLPETDQKRLRALVADVPQIVLLSRPPGRHREVMKEVINSVRQRDNQPCLQFRLDDDDAVGITFVARLRQIAAEIAGLMDDHRHVAIDFPKGFIARPSATGLSATEIHQPFWTPGLAMMVRDTVDLTIMNFAHQRMGRIMPSLSFPQEVMRLRGHNDFNDSRQGPDAKRFDLNPLDRQGEELFRKVYNIDADHVRQVFADRNGAA